MSDVTTDRELVMATKRKWFRWPGIVYLVLLVAAIAFNLSLRSQELSLIGQRGRLQSQLQQQAKQATALESLLDDVRTIADAQAKEIRDLKKMFRDVKARDQFLVTEGERIVWSMKRFTARGEQILWFYIPAGSHRLVYSVNQFLGDGYYARSAKVTRCDQRGLPETAAVAVEGPTVYQLRVAIEPTEGRNLQIELSGRDDNTIHDADYSLAYPARISLGNLQNDSEKMMAYPGELRTHGDAKAHVTARKSDPVAGMMTLLIDDLGGRGKESKGRVVIRFWIDSGECGCMSDVNVAKNYKFLASMKPSNSATRPPLDQTFQLYDDSGRYFFREGYFPPPTPITGIDRLPAE